MSATYSHSAVNPASRGAPAQGTQRPLDADARTVAAVATPPGEGGIAIIRLSGPDSVAVADRVFRHKTVTLAAMPGGRFVHGSVVSPDGTVIDEVVVLVFRAPYSYTREDVVEFQSHGGAVCARRILAALLDAGAHAAAPGEFTRRAFLNGRIDLLQAEAVLDLIRASTDGAARAAIEQLTGRLSRAFDALYAELLAIAADLAATLDFEDGELPAASMSDIRQRLDAMRPRIDDLLSTWEDGRRWREGVKVSIAGAPNAGKSSLMNALLEADRAIVSEHPGTTRDTIEEQMVLGGIAVRLTDTAGLREAACAIEREGVLRARQAIADSDLLLYIVDGVIGLTASEQTHLAALDPAKALVLWNKSDLTPGWRPPPDARYLSCSLKTGSGIDAIREALRERVGAHRGHTPRASISERHRILLIEVRRGIEEALDLMRGADTGDDGTGDDGTAVAATLARESLELLGQITGRTYTESLLDDLFARFCVGK